MNIWITTSHFFPFFSPIHMCVCVCITRDSRNEHPELLHILALVSLLFLCQEKGFSPFFFSQMPRVIFKTQLQSFFFQPSHLHQPYIYLYIYIYIPWENVCLQDPHKGRICLWGRHLYSRKPFLYLLHLFTFVYCLRMVCVCIIGFIFLPFINILLYIALILLITSFEKKERNMALFWTHLVMSSFFNYYLSLYYVLFTVYTFIDFFLLFQKKQLLCLNFCSLCVEYIIIHKINLVVRYEIHTHTKKKNRSRFFFGICLKRPLRGETMAERTWPELILKTRQPRK